MIWYDQNKKKLQILLEVILMVVFITLFLWFVTDFTHLRFYDYIFVLIASFCLYLCKQMLETYVLTKHINKAEEDLDRKILNSQGLFFEVFRNSPIPYLLVDTEGNISAANVSAFRILGMSEGSLEGTNIKNYFINDNSHTNVVENKVKIGLYFTDEEIQLKPHKGDSQWVSMSLFPFTDEYGVKRAMVTLVDIEKHKQIEAAKTEFVSLASHQLRTPIAGMKWNAELLTIDGAETLSENQRRYIDRLIQSINSIDRLVSDFLKVSRFELGTFVPEYSEVNVKTVFDSVFSELTPKIVYKNLTINRKYDKSIKTIQTDAGLFQNIISNLISNAVKYSKPDGEINVQYYINEANQFECIIKDSGIGIPEIQQKNIFRKLYRASNAVSKVPNGTGLGLYIVKEAVSILRGSINYHSKEDEGTTFIFRLPYQDKL